MFLIGWADGKHVALACRVKVNHPLVKDDMVIQSLEGQCVCAFPDADGDFPYGLLAKHVLLPTLRTERFLKTERMRLAAVEAH